MIRERHARPAEIARGVGHASQRDRTVAVGRVNLQIRVRSGLAIGLARQHVPHLGKRQEPSPQGIRFRHSGRVVEPRVDLRADPGTDAAELGE